MEDKHRTLIPLALAVSAAIVYLVVLDMHQRDLERSQERARVLVARVDIPERTLLKEDLVRMESIPRRYVAQDSFEVRTPSDIKLIANLVNRVRIPKGNQIVQSALSSLSPTAGLSVKIPPGYRGAVLPVEMALMKLIKPGDHCDVLLTFDATFADNRRRKATITLLQNVMVLGVGSNLGQGLVAREHAERSEADAQASAFAEKGEVSVALNPKETQYLALAMKQGDVFVALRGLGDIEMHPIEMASLDALFHN